MTVSIIIKALNEERRIAAAIESALAALPAGQGEVILADSGSTDRTIEIAKQYPIIIVQIEAPAKPSCGLGPQLGYQYSQYPYICLMDGDTELAQDFIVEAMQYLEANARVAGVTGHVMERNHDNLEYVRRGLRKTAYKAVGVIDRINCGGLYRREAIENIGYLSDRNLHSYEEYDLGVRLREKGWTLFRLDRRFVYHTGHNVNAYKLLIRRWQTKYIRGIGELLRSATGKPHFKMLFADLPELRLWMAVYGWIILMLLLFVVLPHMGYAVLVDLMMIGTAVGLMSIKNRSVSIGLYSVVAWFAHAAALPLGFFTRRKNPEAFIESKILQGKSAVD
ncbi:glycosyltransferase [Pseudochrobactrum asaccharolyticum]|uniref:Cellulose synthase/poly-beta-1,6-N-acetylglucosamine synthase-like glycosyltransferase n=1 Tax=Pseudochrobactrum asaccharolyticum TaxID=354351 RepID=A0A366E7R0_9HYPH|nr:glycosyltransferase [Pseudochrobactrum asaccharolyticum]RBO98440.1 cellulose synthase/poly-beta-1,6-N-acetylglucosamine synthase-like glycosyltransferase [Pseudochrobactrum asaccharolyticum]